MRLINLLDAHFGEEVPGKAGNSRRLSASAICNMIGHDELPTVITHPEKVLFPDDGITKGDLAAYYEAMAPVMLPHLRGRPITMERYPAGIDKKGFWQKDVSKGFPAWLKRVEVPKKDGVVHHAVVTDTRSLLWITNQNTITQHVWTSRIPDLDYPDICVFDLDPSTGRSSSCARRRDRPARSAGRAHAAVVGQNIRLEGLSHRRSTRWQDPNRTGRALCECCGQVFVSRAPDHLTQEFSKADRRGRIYVDTGRNGYSATFAAAYTVRAKRGAPVSAPCTWDEIARGEVNPRTFTLRNMPDRVAKVGDLWADMRRRGRSLKRRWKSCARARKSA